MKTPFFSIVIPTLNEEKCLPVILKSLSAQSFRNFELLIVDAHSKDKTELIFEKFKSKIPDAQFLQSTKKHVGFQRNLGAETARGEFLVFFDADVNIGHTFLEEVHVALVKQKIQFATTWVLGDSKEPLDEMMVLMSNLIFELANSLKKPFIWGFNIIVSRNLFFKLHGFREDTKMGEDHDFVMRARKKGMELVLLREPLLTMSLRRFRAQGVLPVLHQSTQSMFHILLKGPITSEFFEYPMGGHVHKRKLKTQKSPARIATQSVAGGKLKNYFKSIDQIQKKFVNLLQE